MAMCLVEGPFDDQGIRNYRKQQNFCQEQVIAKKKKLRLLNVKPASPTIGMCLTQGPHRRYSRYDFIGGLCITVLLRCISPLLSDCLVCVLYYINVLASDVDARYIYGELLRTS
jgi:hypothetical protein